MFATRPTHAATSACMEIPELKHLEADGKIVNEVRRWQIPLLSYIHIHIHIRNSYFWLNVRSCMMMLPHTYMM